LSSDKLLGRSSVSKAKPCGMSIEAVGRIRSKEWHRIKR
jgi:hypothetical protein